MDWQAQQVFKLWFELGSSQMMGPKSLHQGQYYAVIVQEIPGRFYCAKGYI